MMRAVTVLTALCLLLSATTGVQAGEGQEGEDVNPGDDVPFTVLERTTPSQDNTPWELSVALDQEAVDNGTTLQITTQICLNSGVCDPPITQEAVVSDDGATYSMELKPPADHSYVNWRIKATYPDDTTENHPNGDWYKTWSSCYYSEDGYGGVHADGDGCNLPGSGESEGFLPSAGLLTALAAMSGAAVVAVARRR
jgi:hypothetical protein